MIERYTLKEMGNIWQDEFKFKTMLDIEILALEALSKIKKVPKGTANRVKKKAKFKVKDINKLEEKTHHDIVAFVNCVSKSIGPDAKYFHMGLTSSDLLDTTLAVQLRTASDILIKDLNRLVQVLAKKAKLYKDMICIGRSHGIHAEPMTFGLKFVLWYDETKRNLDRLIKAKDAISVGKVSGAIGTYSNIDPSVEAHVCKKLGLRAAKISTQVVQRDIHAEYMSTLAIIAGSLEKFATEIRHLQRTEVLEVEEPFAKGQKGSSAMPHKRNPVICERICGLARLLRANALCSIENIALWHERDISHSSCERIIFPDSTIALDYMLNKFIYVVDGLNVYPANMLANVVRTHGLIFSQRLLIELMNKGLTRQAAYDLVQRNAMDTWGNQTDFKKNLIDDKKILKYLSEKELDKIFNLDYYLRHVGKIFRRFGLSG